MTLKSIAYGFLGLGKKAVVECDFCGRQSGVVYYQLCRQCSGRDLSSIRYRDLEHSQSTRVEDVRDANAKCSYCRSLCAEPRHLCLYCANLHPDSTHIDFRSNKPDLGHGIASCFKCGGIQVVTEDGGTFRYEYWKVGEDKPCTEPYTCLGEYEVVRTRQTECKHSWIQIADHRTGKRGRYNMNSLATGLWQISDVQLQYMREGGEYLWCKKCGLFRYLNPSRRHLLPKEGLGD